MKLAKLLALLCFCLAGRIAEAGPKIEHWIAPSGARVFFVENHTLPILDVQVDFAAGTSFDPPGKSGLAALTQGLLDMGVQGWMKRRSPTAWRIWVRCCPVAPIWIGRRSVCVRFRRTTSVSRRLRY